MKIEVAEIRRFAGRRCLVLDRRGLPAPLDDHPHPPVPYIKLMDGQATVTDTLLGRDPLPVAPWTPMLSPPDPIPEAELPAAPTAGQGEVSS